MMSPKQNKMLYRILASAALLIAAALLPLSGIARLIAFLIPYAIIGWDILFKAARNIKNGQVFDENFLMALATLGALFLGEYAEAVFVMLFYQVGELFQNYAVGRSRESIATLMDIRPDYANIEVNGKIEQVDPEDVHVGDMIIIKPGEKIPLDGNVTSGNSTVDTSALTGESVPRELTEGDEVISGCINLSGVLRVRVTKPFTESTVAKILDLVENSSSKKAKAENFITKFARYYTPAVVLLAAALAFIPPIFVGDFGEWLHRALTFLVISCPCALVISIPLSFFGGIGGASKLGILIKGGNYLEALANAGILVFDKTGTLTKGNFCVTAIHPKEKKNTSANELLAIATLAESYSDHPISRSLHEAYGKPVDPSRVANAQEIPGHGIRIQVDGQWVLAGNDRLMQRENIAFEPCEIVGTIVHIAREGNYLGHIIISDEVKPEAAAAIASLKAQGIRKTVMLTGDSEAVGNAVGKQLGIDEIHAQLLPAQKVELTEQMLATKRNNEQLVFVGDGINDAPVLSRADIGVAMGAMGSAAAIEAADIVLMDDDPRKLAAAIRISRKTLKIVRQNIVFALGIKAIVLVLGALGYASMWAAVFADVGVSVIAILNATRALRVKSIK